MIYNAIFPTLRATPLIATHSCSTGRPKQPMHLAWTWKKKERRVSLKRLKHILQPELLWREVLQKEVLEVLFRQEAASETFHVRPKVGFKSLLCKSDSPSALLPCQFRFEWQFTPGPPTSPNEAARADPSLVHQFNRSLPVMPMECLPLPAIAH